MSSNLDVIDTSVFGGDSEYWVHSKKEIASILLNVMRKYGLVSIYFGEHKEFLQTRILDVDTVGGTLMLEYGADENANQRALSSEKIVFVAREDGVKIQFVANQLERTAFGSTRAYRVALPHALLRVQRRQHYRLKTPLVSPVKCLVLLPQELEYTKKELQLDLRDISVGGVCLMGWPLDVKLVPNLVLPGRLDLPVSGSIWVNLVLRNVFDVTLTNGVRSKSAGCAFVNLPLGDEAKIQRYVLGVERDRNAKLSRVSFGQ